MVNTKGMADAVMIIVIVIIMFLLFIVAFVFVWIVETEDTTFENSTPLLNETSTPLPINETNVTSPRKYNGPEGFVHPLGDIVGV